MSEKQLNWDLEVTLETSITYTTKVRVQSKEQAVHESDRHIAIARGHYPQAFIGGGVLAVKMAESADEARDGWSPKHGIDSGIAQRDMPKGAASRSFSRFAELLETETAAAHRAMDAKEAELDEYGYGGAPQNEDAEAEAAHIVEALEGQIDELEQERADLARQLCDARTSLDECEGDADQRPWHESDVAQISATARADISCLARLTRSLLEHPSEDRYKALDSLARTLLEKWTP